MALSAALLQLRVHLGGEGGPEAAEEERILRDPGEKVTERPRPPCPALLGPDAAAMAPAPAGSVPPSRRGWLEQRGERDAEGVEEAQLVPYSSNTVLLGILKQACQYHVGKLISYTRLQHSLLGLEH